jgi:hypothetical protein
MQEAWVISAALFIRYWTKTWLLVFSEPVYLVDVHTYGRPVHRSNAITVQNPIAKLNFALASSPTAAAITIVDHPIRCFFPWRCIIAIISRHNIEYYTEGCLNKWWLFIIMCTILYKTSTYFRPVIVKRDLHVPATTEVQIDQTCSRAFRSSFSLRRSVIFFQSIALTVVCFDMLFGRASVGAAFFQNLVVNPPL